MKLIKVCPYCGYVKAWSKFRESLDMKYLYCPECFKMIGIEEWK
jgi:hypothetical protein